MDQDTAVSNKNFLMDEHKQQEQEQDYVGSEIANTRYEWREEPINSTMGETLKILDPDDPLMKRFQEALKTHLTRINGKLTEDILDLENAAKEAKKRREMKATELYNAQEDVARQQETVDKYQTKLAELIQLRDEKESRASIDKELKKLARDELEHEKTTADKFALEIEGLSSLNRQFSEWETEIASHLTVAKRMSEKDATIQRDLLRRKQYEDYILAKLMEEIARLEGEIKDCREQLAIKEIERMDARQTITDANADLEGLQRSQKKLFSEWNRVVSSISQRDKVNDELAKDRTKIRESFATLRSQIEKIKKDTNKEMENNESLTAIQSRLEDDVKYTLGIIANEKMKIEDLENQIIKVSRLSEQTQNEFDTACWDYQRRVEEEKSVDKHLEKLSNEKCSLEDAILSRLENKVSHDKAIKALNKKLRDSRDQMREQELTMLQSENTYGKNILEIEKHNAFLSTEKFDVDELSRMNNTREKELDAMQTELKKSDLSIVKKQQKIVNLNKKIEETISSLAGGEDLSPQDMKIAELETNIEEIESNNRKSQELWLRREGYMVTLSEERTAQLSEINLLGKQITIMEQKNFKLGFEIERQKKEDEIISRTVKVMQQKLVNANARLAEKREIRDDLEGKNCMTKSECVEALREAEIEAFKLQNDIKQLMIDRSVLEDQLKSAQRETLSWEKKVRLASETAKELKEERSAGGDVAAMKNEIHKMEIRLSHLRKAQENMIRDMEFCVARRDVIMDGAMAREKRNPKGLHNQRVVFEKRMNDQKLKIKQMTKETKQMENQILELESQQKRIHEQLDDNQKTLRSYEDAIPDVDKQISECELIKYHKLECLVRKQRKVRMMQDVKDGRYKMLFKSEMSLNDELHKQRAISADLKDVMEETRRDFPLLKDSIRKIILGMETT